MKGSKRMKMPKRPKTQVIHGTVVTVGTGVGQRVGKKATSAVAERRRRMKEELGY